MNDNDNKKKKKKKKKVEFYIDGSTLLCQFIEPVTFFARLYLHCGISHWADI